MALIEDRIGYELKPFGDLANGSIFQIVRTDSLSTRIKCTDKDGDYNHVDLNTGELGTTGSTEVLYYPNAYLETMASLNPNSPVVQPRTERTELMNLNKLSFFRFVGHKGTGRTLRSCLKLENASPDTITAVDLETGEIFNTKGGEVSHLPDARINLFRTNNIRH